MTTKWIGEDGRPHDHTSFCRANGCTPVPATPAPSQPAGAREFIQHFYGWDDSDMTRSDIPWEPLSQIEPTPTPPASPTVTLDRETLNRNSTPRSREAEMSDRTEEIRARVEKASCGPWQVIRKGDPDHDWLLASFGAASDDDRQVELHTDGVRGDGLSSAENDADFCAHARTDIPYLLTELTALREENARLKGAATALLNWRKHPAHGGRYELPKPMEPYLLQLTIALSSSPAQRESDHAGL